MHLLLKSPKPEDINALINDPAFQTLLEGNREIVNQLVNDSRLTKFVRSGERTDEEAREFFTSLSQEYIGLVEKQTKLQSETLDILRTKYHVSSYSRTEIESALSKTYRPDLINIQRSSSDCEDCPVELGVCMGNAWYIHSGLMLICTVFGNGECIGEAHIILLGNMMHCYHSLVECFQGCIFQEAEH